MSTRADACEELRKKMLGAEDQHLKYAHILATLPAATTTGVKVLEYDTEKQCEEQH